MNVRLTPAAYEAQFTTPPETGECWSVITCTHPYHGVRQFFLPLDDFQEKCMGLIRPYWVNGFTIVIQDVK